MKENSIEEDIEIIESIIEEYENCCVPEIDMQVDVTFREKQNNALNHILSDYKRVLKENEKLNNRCRNLDKEAQGYLEELAGDDTLSTRTMKQLQKENEELKEINEQLSENKLLQDIEIKKKFIPIQKVKDKIETLEKIQKEFPNNERLEVKIIAYKELLGKE